MTTGRSPEHVPAPTSSIATEDTATPPHGLAAPGQDTPSPSGGALAVLPPIAVGFVWRTPLPRLKRFGVAAAAWIAILVLGAGITRAVITERTERDDQQLAMVDIIGILNYGPTIAVYRSLAEQPERQLALDHDLDELARRFDLGGDGRLIMNWEYLLIIARVR